MPPYVNPYFAKMNEPIDTLKIPYKEVPNTLLAYPVGFTVSRSSKYDVVGLQREPVKVYLYDLLIEGFEIKEMTRDGKGLILEKSAHPTNHIKIDIYK